MSVFAGIISGLVGGILYNRFHTVKLPEFLGAFSGSRFVPIVTAGASILLALIFGVIWGSCQEVIRAVGEWIAGAGVFGTFAFGVLNRLLIPVGLHHIIGGYIGYMFGEYINPVSGVVVTGDINRFFDGDYRAD